MPQRILIKKRSISILLPVITFLTFFSIKEKVSPVFFITVLLWTSLFFNSIFNIKESPLVFCFLISFYVFLLGRQVCFHFLHIDQVYDFLDVVNNYTYFCLIVSLLGIALGIRITGKRKIVKKIIISPIKTKQNRDYNLACKLVYYCCLFATIYGTVLQIRFVQRVGYLESYTGDAGGAGIPTVVSYLSKFTPISLCFFLATKPTKRDAIIPLVAYEGYAVLTVLTGQRFPFIGISMFILVYYLLRSTDEKGWIKKYHYYLLTISVPILMILITAYDAIRLGNSFSFNNLFETINNFFIQQGGSVNTIRRTIYNRNQLNDMRFVSFSSIYSSLFENGISRRLFHIKTFSGNSIERAFQTNSLAHRLSYIAYGKDYLNGKGTGSSYIAELLHDFGLFGVFIGSFLYGILLCKIDKITFSNKVVDGIKLAMVYYLLFAPRGSFDSFIGSVFNLYSMLGVIGIMVFTMFISQIPKTKKREQAASAC